MKHITWRSRSRNKLKEYKILNVSWTSTIVHSNTSSSRLYRLYLAREEKSDNHRVDVGVTGVHWQYITKYISEHTLHFYGICFKISKLTEYKMSDVLTVSVSEAAWTGSDNLSHVNASSDYGHFCNPFCSVRQSGSLQHRPHVSRYTTSSKHHL